MSKHYIVAKNKSQFEEFYFLMLHAGEVRSSKEFVRVHGIEQIRGIKFKRLIILPDAKSTISKEEWRQITLHCHAKGTQMFTVTASKMDAIVEEVNKMLEEAKKNEDGN